MIGAAVRGVETLGVLSTVWDDGGLFIDMLLTTGAPANYQVLAH